MFFRGLTLSIIIILLPSFAAAQLSKGEVDEQVVKYARWFKEDIRGKDGCDSLASSLIFSLEGAHQYFMSDRPGTATLYAIDLLEESGAKAYKHVTCPFVIVPKVNIAKVYMTYFFEHRKPDTTLNTTKNTVQLTEGDRDLLDYRYLKVYQRIDSLCNQTKCSSYESKIVSFSKALYDDVHKSNEVDIEVLVVRSLALRKIIAEGVWVSKNQNTLFDINKDLPAIFRVLKRYLFTKPEVSVQDKFKLSIFDTIAAETVGYSSCPILLYGYYIALDAQLNNTKDYDLIQYVGMTGRLFEALNKSIYERYFNRNQFCTLPDNQYMYNLPFEFSKEVKKMIYAAVR